MPLALALGRSCLFVKRCQSTLARFMLFLYVFLTIYYVDTLLGLGLTNTVEVVYTCLLRVCNNGFNACCIGAINSNVMCRHCRRNLAPT